MGKVIKTINIFHIISFKKNVEFQHCVCNLFFLYKKIFSIQVKLWHIPDGGLSMHLTDWLVELHGHKRRVAYIEWHPTAENILLSAGFDYLVSLDYYIVITYVYMIFLTTRPLSKLSIGYFSSKLSFFLFYFTI